MLIEGIGQGGLTVLFGPATLHTRLPKVCNHTNLNMVKLSLVGRARAQGNEGNEVVEVRLD